MKNYQHAILDEKTGETKFVDFTKEEIEIYEKELADWKAEKAAKEAEFAVKAAARQSALEKLAALGLTEAEIQALAG